MSLLSGATKEESITLIETLLANVELSNLKHQKLSDLSSGQKKMVMIIQAFINKKSQLFIMDEPTENLDPKHRQIFYQLVKEANQQGKTFFISTHNLDEIKLYATCAIFIKNGRIVSSNEVKKRTNLHSVYNSL
jgi:ABC-2 type transport system ATP-binding protein